MGGRVYVFGDDKLTVSISAKCLSDLLDLARTDVGERGEDDLLVGAEKFV